MIISHKHQFIFLKTNKTAGTSIEIALSKFCGPDDIITRISEEDEAIRKGLGYPGPQNYQTPNCKFYNHMPAVEIKAHIDPQIWDSYFKFCFVRNPWDRAISHYYWVYQTEPRKPVATFIKSNRLMKLVQGGYDLYTINKEIVVDKVCRFEKIADELEAVRVQLGIEGQFTLPQAKSQFRQDKKNYRELLDETDKARVAEIFADEIKLFGYEF